MDQVLEFDFDALTVGEIDFLEDTLNEKLRDQLGGRMVTFNDIIEQFRARKPDSPPLSVTIPMGKILRTMAWMQIRKSNPDATWEDAGELKLKVEVAPPKDSATLLAQATEAAQLPNPEMQELLTMQPLPTYDDDASRSWPGSAATGESLQPTTTP